MTGLLSQYICCVKLFSVALDILLALMSLYLILISGDMKWVGLVRAVQHGADLIGSAIAPFITINPQHFFS